MQQHHRTALRFTAIARRGALLALGLGALAAPTPAAADFASDFNSFVAELDASPDWAVQARNVATTSDGGTIGELSIRAEEGVLWVDIEAITVSGYATGANGALSTSVIDVGRVRFELGKANVTIEGTRLDGLAWGEFAPITAGMDQPMTLMGKLYGAMAMVQLDGGSVAKVVAHAVEGEAKSDVSYVDLKIGRLRNGELDGVSTGAIVLETEDSDADVTFRIGSTEARNFSFTAFADVFDPDRYVNGAGDMRWRNALALGRYRNIEVTVPDGRFQIGEMLFENLQMRQPAKSFSGALDKMVANPDMSEAEKQELGSQFMIDYLSAFSLGRFGFDEFSAVGPGVDRLRIGGLRLIDMSIEGFGEIAVSDVEVAVPDAGEFTLRRFSVGDIVFPEVEAMRAAIEAEGDPMATDGLFDFEIGFAELIGMRIIAPEMVDLTLARARMDMTAFIGPIPTSVTAEVNGLEVDATIIEDEMVKEILARLGYERLTADYGYKVYWREIDQRLIVEDLRMNVAQAGSVNIDVELSGLTRADIEDPQRLQDALDRLKFENASIRVKDDSLMNRVFEMQAGQLGLETELLKQQVGDALPLFLLPIGNGEFQRKLAPVLKEFIKAPGTILLRAQPGMPVPLAQLFEAAQSDPSQLPDLLDIEVTKEQ